MVTEHGIKFGVHLITKHFGKIVAKVCEKLFSHGPLTLDQLVRYTDFTKDQVRNSLLVLVQHNCAQAFVSAPQDDDDDADRLRVRTQYLVLFDNIIHRLRFPKFLDIVSRKLDEECVKLLVGLLRDGRLTLKQMVDRESQGKASTLVEKRKASKFLKELWKDNYLHKKTVPVTGGRPSNICMWKVNKPLLWKYVLDEMYHAALNLSLRMT
ncbi:hypothetical protein AAZX31_20G145000 [Glycine max]